MKCLALSTTICTVLTCCLIIWLVLFFSLSSCGCLGWSGRYCGNRNGSVCVVWRARFWDLSEQRWATNREWFRGCEKKKFILYLLALLVFTFLWLMEYNTYNNPSHDHIFNLTHIQRLWPLYFSSKREWNKSRQGFSSSIISVLSIPATRCVCRSQTKIWRQLSCLRTCVTAMAHVFPFMALVFPSSCRHCFCYALCCGKKTSQKLDRNVVLCQTTFQLMRQHWFGSANCHKSFTSLNYMRVSLWFY